MTDEELKRTQNETDEAISFATMLLFGLAISLVGFWVAAALRGNGS